MSNKKTLLAVTLLVMTMTFSSILMVYAPPTGVVRIDPPLPYMSESPAQFTVWVQGATDATQPHIFLVMTEACFDGLSGDVEVSWPWAQTGFVTVSGWKKETLNSVKLPPLTTPGAGYTVASLKDHLGTDGAIYWAIAGILDDNPIETGETYEIEVTMTSTNPEMLVYVIGKSSEAELFDMVVPPTIPGFMVPEIPLGTLASIITMAGSMAVLRRRKK